MSTDTLRASDFLGGAIVYCPRCYAVNAAAARECEVCGDEWPDATPEPRSPYAVMRDHLMEFGR